MHDTLLDLLDDRARTCGSRPLYEFIESEERWSAADVLERAARTATQISRSGVDAGARVGILVDDRRRFLDGFFGCQYRGAVPVPLGLGGKVGSRAWSAHLRRRVDSLALHALICDPTVMDFIGEALTIAVLTVDGSAGAVSSPGPRQPVALIQPSSGTTGDPKGILLSHSALIANIAAMTETLAATPEERVLTWLPFFHDMGLIGTVLAPLYFGGRCTIWSPDGFVSRPRDWFRLIEKRSISITVMPPFALDILRRNATRTPMSSDALASLRAVLVGSERIRPAVLEQFGATLESAGLARTAVLPVYGLAEATLAVTITASGRGARVVDLVRGRAVSCGPPVPGVELRVDDFDELLVRTPAVMDGYLGDDEATSAAFDGEWLRTGDLAVIDDGEAVILGRTKEAINRNGVRTPAGDFEAIAGDVENIRPDRVVAFQIDHGERHAVVVVAETTDMTRRDGTNLETRRCLSDAGLAADVVHLVPLGWLPRTTSGKVRRDAVRAKFEADVNAPMTRGPSATVGAR